MATEEQVGYEDAMRQVHRSLQRRLNNLEDAAKSGQSEEEQLTTRIRIEEIRHIMGIVESLHR